MDELTKLMNWQLESIDLALAELTNLKKQLKEKATGGGVSEAVKKLEATLGRFSVADRKTKHYLSTKGVKTIAEFLENAPNAVDSERAEELLKELQKKQAAMKATIGEANTLLNRSKEFIDFNVNIMAKATAGTTYGAPGRGYDGGSRKLFDANV